MPNLIVTVGIASLTSKETRPTVGFRRWPNLCVDLSITFSAYLQLKSFKLKHVYVIKLTVT